MLRIIRRNAKNWFKVTTKFEIKLLIIKIKNNLKKIFKKYLKLICKEEKEEFEIISKIPFKSFN